MFRLLLAFTAAFALLPAAGTAQAQSCGDTITHDITLTADLHCTSGAYALAVTGNGITIDLNGHTISGTRDLSGIHLYNTISTHIVNGTLKGFWGGVIGGSEHYLELGNVNFFDVGMGVSLNGAAKTWIHDNHFHTGSFAILLTSRSAHDIGGSHRIAYNRIHGGQTGIELCGQKQSYNTVLSNDLINQVSFGIHVREGSGKNEIERNSIASKLGVHGIVLRASDDNDVLRNVVEGGNTGIALYPDAMLGALCHPGDSDGKVSGNGIYYNTLEDQKDWAAYFGLGNLKGPWVLKNGMGKNDIVNAPIGIYLDSHAYYNDLRVNFFHAVPEPVRDLGVGNAW